MYNPIATYRIQFHSGFTFKDFEEVINYLKKLGISTVYASPVFASVAGSAHGYDGLDPNRINPEIGTEEEFKHIVSALKEDGIGWLQDIVPNHMAFDMANEWLWDVLEKGAASEYAGFFDIDWNNADAGKKLMVPFISEPVEDMIARRAIKIVVADNRWVLECNGIHYPLNKASVGLITDAEKVNEDIDLVKRIVDEQFYRLCNWQETDEHINYRRFFTINGLICLNIQNEQVFETYHRLVKTYVNEGYLDGLRIDHIDGLYDPEKYLDTLRNAVGKDAYISVEKILKWGEQLPDNWATQGTTGYDFLAAVNNLFTNNSAKEAFKNLYKEFAGENTDVAELVYEKKALILHNHMKGELNNLLRLFKRNNLANAEELAQIGDNDLRQAIAEFLIACPVYRFYGNQIPLSEQEAREVELIFGDAKVRKPDLAKALELLERIITEKPGHGDEEYDTHVLQFYMRCMQFTGPLMAKGVEDTLMYSYNCFISNNEVGDSPEHMGRPVQDFHQFMIDRQARWPMAMNATSTHDTKRGEDTRARLAVLSDMSEEWIKAVKEWSHVNETMPRSNKVDKNDKYLIYQALLGAYPMPGTTDDVEGRMHAYLEKALREAKTHSNWTTPDIEYEESAKEFLSSLLESGSEFCKSFNLFFDKIVDHGIVNSLSQLILKFTCPGIPDIYQGTELWDLSLVDPDNRRPVDYATRNNILAETANSEYDCETLWKERYSGGIKLWLTKRLLAERQATQDLYLHGSYLPLEIQGKYKANILAFARVYKKQWHIAVVPLHTAACCDKGNLIEISWEDTYLQLPGHAPEQWLGIINGGEFSHGNEIDMSKLFSKLPMEILSSVPNNTDRKAGVLAAVSSLPSYYGIGDLGPGAYSFADFLHRSGQSYWQLLPLNPIAASDSFSPYSSISSMAGNVLLISPDMLEKAGLLSTEDLRIDTPFSTSLTEYKRVADIKNELLAKAYDRYQNGTFTSLQQEYKAFCDEEQYWLNDFALYVALKERFDSQPWYKWPDEYKFRDIESLNRFSLENASDIDRIKWLQFIFNLQWKTLKDYCNHMGVELLGDIPFYISYDSVDVWSNREIFSLDEAGNVTGVAGVPPDYFSEDGQLWGMPTFNWEKIKDTDYDWWIKRLKRNLILFDLIRLDHFRAFAEYWEVPSGETTAKNGKWLPGPGQSFFAAINQSLGKLPFVAEDLGDNMDKVYELREKVRLPGMKVLQFAFGKDIAISVDIPHNYPSNCIVYTGTHDNNTIIGWYINESTAEDRKRLEEYTGCKVTIENVHNVLIRVAYASIAQTVIIPLQDILGLDEQSRMNTPGAKENNWLWRFSGDQLTAEAEQKLRRMTQIYGRY